LAIKGQMTRKDMLHS